MNPRRRLTWLFDLDNTLHDASHAVFPATARAMNDYIVDELGLVADDAARLRDHYWRRYGATLLGLVRHHGVDAAHFLEATHRHPGLEQRVRTSRPDRIALARLPGRKILLTNAPRTYALRVLHALRLDRAFDSVLAIEDMTMFGALRPKPDPRLFRHLTARLRVRASDCVLVEDTLVNQRAARSVGMRTAWMQRYLDGRFRGHPRRAAAPGAVPVTAPASVPVMARRPLRRCPNPAYVCVKIRTLQQLLAAF